MSADPQKAPESEVPEQTPPAGKRRRAGADRFALRDSPVFAAVVLLLFTLGVVLLPGEKLGKLLLGHGGTDARNLGNALFRLAGWGVSVWLAVDLGLRIFSFRGCARGALLCLPFAAVIIDNAPLTGLWDGTVTISAGAGSYVIFALCCIAVGLFEETMFRGLLLPLFLRAFPRNRKGTLAAVLLSSALFGAVHLVNLFGNAPGPVLMQVGYSFLIGCMCALAMLLGHNIFLCVGLHAAFNFCGLLADDLGTGQVWTPLNITLTAAVGVLAAAYGIWLFVKKVRPERQSALFADTSENNETKETDQ